MSTRNNKPIKIWAFGNFVPIVEKAIKSYHELTNSDTIFEIENIDQSGMFSAFSNYNLYAKDKLPDVFLIKNQEIKKYLTNFSGLFSILDDWVDPNSYMPCKIADISENDNIYGIPCTSDPVALFYNNSLLQNLGIDLLNENTTWEDLIKLKDSLKPEEKYLFPPATWLTQILMQSTGRLYCDSEKNISAENSLEILELIDQLNAAELLYPDTTIQTEDVYGLLMNGKILAAMGSTELFSEIKRNVTGNGIEDEWRVTKIPKSNVCQFEADLGGYSWLVLNKDNHDELLSIMDFLMQMFGQKNNSSCNLIFEMASKYDMVPSLNSVGDILDSLSNNGCFSEPQVIKYLYQIGHEVPAIYFNEYTDDITQEFNSLVTDLINQQKTVDEAYDVFYDICKYYDDLSGKISDYELIKIKITCPPVKTTYYIYEEFSCLGMCVTAYFSNGLTKQVTNYTWEPKIFTQSSPSSSVEITYKFKEKTASATQLVTINDRKLLSVTPRANRMFFQYDSVTDADFNLLATFDEGDPAYINDFTVSPTSLNQVGEVFIQISFKYGSETRNEQLLVTVYAKLDHIKVIKLPNKLSYLRGERFDRTGLGVVAYYSDNTQRSISSGSLVVSPNTVQFNSGENYTQLNISYTEYGYTAKSSLTVYKKLGLSLDECDISQDMSKCGNGTINLSNGKLTYSFNDFTGVDPVFPISISHIYNEDTGNMFCVGNNWRLNLQQEIYIVDNKWQYTDGKGKKYLFDNGYESKDDRSSIRNEKLGLDLFLSKDAQHINLIDRNNNTLVFDLIAAKYRLTAIHLFPSSPDSPINAYSLKITYGDDGKLNEVIAGSEVDGHRPSITLIYLDGLLSRLQYNLEQTIVAKYSYDDSNLAMIELLNENTKSEFSCQTKFITSKEEFSVFDLSSKNLQGTCKALRYLLDSNNRVINYSVGYDVEERDTTTISYLGNRFDVNDGDNEENADASFSTITENNGLVNILSFNKMSVVSQYSYYISGTTASHMKPAEVIGAQSHGFNYKSLAELYADTLDVFHDDFETGTDGWHNATTTVESAISGQSCIFGKNLNKNYTLASNTYTKATTMYLSLWACSNSSSTPIRITVTISGSESGQLIQNLDRNLSNKWQFTALCLGKIKMGDSIAIQVSCENNSVYIDDVRLTQAPYEMPDNIAENTYDSFGNLLKSYKYNPVNQKIEITDYTYDSKHQLTEQITWTDNSVQKNHIVNEYKDGLLISRKEFGRSKSSFTQEEQIYRDGVLKNSLDRNNVVKQYSDGKDYSETISIGETDSPTMKQRESYFPNSNIIQAVSSGQQQNCYTYRTDGKLQNVQSNNSVYTYGHDTFGNMNAFNIGDISLIKMEYDYKHLNKSTYANGDTVSYTYDNKDRIVKVTENAEDAVIIKYDAEDAITVTHSNSDKLTYSTRPINKTGITSEYQVQFSNPKDTLRIVRHASATENAHDINTISYFINGSEIPFEKCKLSQDGDELLTSIERSNHGANVTYAYDELYRLSGKTTTYDKSTSAKMNFTTNYIYDYNLNSNNRKSTLVTAEEYINGSTKHTSQYKYYRNGNLKQLAFDSNTICEYFYDECGQLVREDNFALLLSYRYTYDKGGNILAKETYLIKDGEIDPTPSKIDYYDYETITENYNQNSAWHDQLKSYNNEPIKYDKLGNPVKYFGKNMTWLGRKLIQLDDVAMEYDYNDLRIKKGNKKYYWQRNNLIMEQWTKNNQENYIYYYYDETGICGMNYNGTEYYYRKNILGDVLAVYDKNGTLLCRYIYDAWGNHKIYNAIGSEINSNDINNIGNINPIRYRGYYWDTEFGLYYLQSRYYDSSIGRFISPDDVGNINSGRVMGYNLYVYCGNNPIMYIDPTGKSFIVALIIGAVVGAVISFCIACVIQIATEKKIDWKKVAVSTAFGAVGGILSASGVGGFIAQALINTILGVGETYALAALDGTVSSVSLLETVATSLVFGCLGAAIATGVTNGFKRLGQFGSSFIKYAGQSITRYAAPTATTLQERFSRYAYDFIFPTFRQGIVSAVVSSISNIFSRYRKSWKTYCA